MKGVDMKIICTVRELIDKGLWSEYCKETGVSEWAVKDGLISDSQEILWERF